MRYREWITFRWSFWSHFTEWLHFQKRTCNKIKRKYFEIWNYWGNVRNIQQFSMQLYLWRYDIHQNDTLRNSNWYNTIQKNGTALIRMTRSCMKLNRMTFTRIKLNRMPLEWMTLSKTTISMTKNQNDTYQKDT